MLVCQLLTPVCQRVPLCRWGPQAWTSEVLVGRGQAVRAGGGSRGRGGREKKCVCRGVRRRWEGLGSPRRAARPLPLPSAPWGPCTPAPSSDHLINSSQQPCEVGRAGSSVSIYTDVEAEAQRGLMTCSRPHSKLAIELGPELGLGARLSPLTAVSSRGPQPLSRVSATPEPGPPAPWQ